MLGISDNMIDVYSPFTKFVPEKTVLQKHLMTSFTNTFGIGL